MFELIESGEYGPDQTPHIHHQGYWSGCMHDITERDD